MGAHDAWFASSRLHGELRNRSAFLGSSLTTLREALDARKKAAAELAVAPEVEDALTRLTAHFDGTAPLRLPEADKLVDLINRHVRAWNGKDY